jgi:hypothetical protein
MTETASRPPAGFGVRTSRHVSATLGSSEGRLAATSAYAPSSQSDGAASPLIIPQRSNATSGSGGGPRPWAAPGVAVASHPTQIRHRNQPKKAAQGDLKRLIVVPSDLRPSEYLLVLLRHVFGGTIEIIAFFRVTMFMEIIYISRY